MSRGGVAIRHRGLKGLVSFYDPASLDREACQKAQNVIFSRGRIETRPGMRRLSTARPGGADSTCQGVYQFRDRAGTLQRVIVADGALYSFDYPWTAFTLVGTLSGGVKEHCSFASDGNVLFIATGYRIYTWDSANTELGQWQLDAPTVALSPTAQGSGGSLGAGDYQYQYTWYSSLTGAESAPRAAETVTTVASDSVQITVPAPQDDYWDSVRVYRTTVDGSTFQLMDTYTTSGTKTDTKADTALGDAITTTSAVRLFDGTDGPKYIAFHKGRLWFAGFTQSGQGDRLYWSEPANAHLVNSTNFDRVTAAAGEPLTAIHPVRGHMMAFSKHSASRYSGDPGTATSPGDLSDNRVDGGQGCLSHSSCVEIDGYLWRLSTKGIYITDGFGDRGVTRHIQDLFDDPAESNSDRMDQDQGWEASAADLKLHRCYLLAYTREGQSQPDRILCLHYGLDLGGDAVPVSLWGGGSGSSIEPRFLATVEDDSALEKVLFGDSLGFLYEASNETQDGMSTTIASGTATGGSSTTLTDTGASWPTADDGLDDAYVTVIDSDGTEQTAKITANTGTQITVASWPSFTPASGDTYHLGAIDSEFVGPDIPLEELDPEGGMSGQEREKLAFWVSWWWSTGLSHSGPVYLGYRVNGDSSAEATDSLTALTKYGHKKKIMKRVTLVAPKARSIGAAIPLKMLGWAIEARPTGHR